MAYAVTTVGEYEKWWESVALDDWSTHGNNPVLVRLELNLGLRVAAAVMCDYAFGEFCGHASGRSVCRLGRVQSCATRWRVV